MTEFSRIAIVGLGLIGGSLAKRIRRVFPHTHIVAVDLDAECLDLAHQDGTIDAGVSSISGLTDPLDAVFVAVPMGDTAAVIRQVAHQCSAQTLISDVASVKQPIIDQLGVPVIPNYVPGHPMAGNEHQGYRHATAELMAGAPYVLVQTDFSKWMVFCQFLQQLSFQVVVLDPRRHDQLVAQVSHSGYWVSASLGAVMGNKAEAHQQLAQSISGPGFQSMTRLCGMDPFWGMEVAVHNKDEVLRQLTEVRDQLNDVIDAVGSEDRSALQAIGQQARALYRRFYS